MVWYGMVGGMQGLGGRSLKWECYHFDEIFIIGCTGSCYSNIFQYSQWWKFHQTDIATAVVVIGLWRFICKSLSSIWHNDGLVQDCGNSSANALMFMCGPKRVKRIWFWGDFDNFTDAMELSLLQCWWGWKIYLCLMDHGFVQYWCAQYCTKPWSIRQR